MLNLRPYNWPDYILRLLSVASIDTKTVTNTQIVLPVVYFLEPSAPVLSYTFLVSVRAILCHVGPDINRHPLLESLQHAEQAQKVANSPRSQERVLQLVTLYPYSQICTPTKSIAIARRNRGKRLSHVILNKTDDFIFDDRLSPIHHLVREKLRWGLPIPDSLRPAGLEGHSRERRLVGWGNWLALKSEYNTYKEQVLDFFPLNYFLGVTHHSKISLQTKASAAKCLNIEKILRFVVPIIQQPGTATYNPNDNPSPADRPNRRSRSLHVEIRKVLTNRHSSRAICNETEQSSRSPCSVLIQESRCCEPGSSAGIFEPATDVGLRYNTVVPEYHYLTRCSNHGSHFPHPHGPMKPLPMNVRCYSLSPNLEFLHECQVARHF
ncbi:uncharacterized protein BDR25DRAFT_348619 [Lindgomyces ingoldianus]|uniref:Uncharacterized protein n=1 Tax=Lindgomyces ingoldianus TaxID=673940 RepID=A0ACB6RGI1_9PLEO|nr:uncharacterized protein BDR25DRAFT_348619 [Lindgomyces ingoldianus]KAF2478364.1 hypothetical protein BDR25DRAFT_348619 [Lindgomyces ingoldianus]